MKQNATLSRNYSGPTNKDAPDQKDTLAAKLQQLTRSNETEQTDETDTKSEFQVKERPEALKEEIDGSYIEDAEKSQANIVLELNMPQNHEVVDMKEDFKEDILDNELRTQTTTTETEEKSPQNENSEDTTENQNIYIIKNIDTGEVYDLRDPQQFQKMNDGLSPSPDKYQRKSAPWQEFWKNVRKNNEKLWDYCELGKAEKVKEILDRKNQLYPADVNSRLLDDMTALHLAANEGHLAVTEVLLENEANKEAVTKMGRTPLHVAVLRGNTEIVKLLLEKGANINASDSEFNTPLHYASERGFTETVKILLEYKPDVTKKNHAKLTAIDVALNLEIRNIFGAKGLINDSTVNSFGRTSVDEFLIYNSRADLVGKLLHMSNMNMKHMQQQQIKKVEESKSNEKKGSKPKADLGITNIVIHTDKARSPSDFSSDEKIGPHSFSIFHLLGKGSFGEVYLVEKITSGKRFAMKVLRKDKIVNQNLTRYAKTERNVLSIMNHPFIVKLNYAFQTDSKLYLLLDFCPGGDLGGVISRKRKLSEDVARIYAAEILLALEALHKNYIVFRDLKPDNVVIDAEGHAQLTDFGLSKEGVNNNLSKSFCGSVAYLAPEMLRRSGHNRTVDWYLLGVLIYEMLVGIPPYFSSNRDELFENIQKAQLKLPRSMSEEAKSLIKGLLNRNPAKRLGAENDAEDIKSHPWFKSINWNDALQRKLKPPPAELRKFPSSSVRAKINDAIPEKDIQNYVSNWSFAVPDDQA